MTDSRFIVAFNYNRNRCNYKQFGKLLVPRSLKRQQVFFSLDLLQLEYRHYRGIVFSNDIYVLCRDVYVYFTGFCREVDTSS